MQDLTPRNNLLAENVVVADAGSVVVPSVSSMQKYDAAFSVCGAAVPTTHRDYQLANYLEPTGLAWVYLKEHGIAITGGATNVSIIEAPKHGVLNTEGLAPWVYKYVPKADYLGPDQITFVVEWMGKKFKVIETVWVENAAPDFGGCPADYKLPPATTGSDKRGALDVIELPVDGTLDTDALAKLHAFVSFATGAGLSGNGVTVSIADLPGAAIGQTTGSNITLDTTAAGNGWFIDPTPADNSEYLPTSNPYEWVAKVGSAAYGKMDMLSVLLHEYGHALGIDHSADPNDYMGTTLTPGVRRLPSAEEMALMQQLIGQAKEGLASNNTQDNAPTFPTLPLSGLGLSFIGLLRSSRYGGVSIVPDPSTLVTQYAVAANATFTNLDTATGWNTQGNVDINPSTSSGRTASATLNEISASQTRLSQVFTLNDKNLYNWSHRNQSPTNN